MKKKTIVGLIAIGVAIVAVVAFLVYTEYGRTTSIYGIEQHPDDYIGKRVTIEAYVALWFHTYHDLKGFMITDLKAPYSQIFVEYSGDYPSDTITDKWGRKKDAVVKVTGIVRHKWEEGKGFFYIEGESWEYID